MSPDFRNHSVAYFIRSVLSHHDHDKFEIFCYSNHAAPDHVTEMLRAYADHWRQIDLQSDDEVYELVRGDGIDILVDLAGHTGGNRLNLFAKRPAPVQLSWLGYLNTTGLNSMDYRITDYHVSPVGLHEKHNSECLLRLPDSQWCFTPPVQVPVKEWPPVTEEGFITFGSFNALAKISTAVLDMWSRVLLDVPKSRLRLATWGLEQAEQMLKEEFCKRGIDESRLVFLGHLSFEECLDQHGNIDVFLDTYPISGVTTTCYALWMGVPVVTLAGKTAYSRGSLSLLHTMGLAKWVAESEQAYVRTATVLANDLDELAKMRRELRNRIEASPLMDESRFCTNIEKLYFEAWGQEKT